jgi:hypothetical protein
VFPAFPEKIKPKPIRLISSSVYFLSQNCFIAGFLGSPRFRYEEPRRLFQESHLSLLFPSTPGLEV